VDCFECSVYGLGNRLQGLEFRVEVVNFRIWLSGSRVSH